MGVMIGQKEAIMETVKVVDKLSDERKRKIVLMSTPMDTSDYYEKRRRSERIDNDNFSASILMTSSSCDNSSGSCDSSSGSCDSSSSSCGGD